MVHESGVLSKLEIAIGLEKLPSEPSQLQLELLDLSRGNLASSHRFWRPSLFLWTRSPTSIQLRTRTILQERS